MISSKKAAKQLNNGGYVKVSGLLEPGLLDFLYSYVYYSAAKGSYLKTYASALYNEHEHGSYKDQQVPGSYSKYGDMVFDTLLASWTDNLGDLICKKLVPTYSYHRLYRSGDVLEKHKDRPACEISVSLPLGYEAPKLWPIFIEGSAIYLDVGDILIYKGCEVEHWREPFNGDHQAQLFLHYNDQKGPYKMKNHYDSRPLLGLSNIHKNKSYKKQFMKKKRRKNNVKI